ncbi:HAD-IIB family hydrolase [Kiritimatiellota bacterium B12222]|nr:HAD-IIB family hydrolase [Kiritimatiellota bacterium B12222]
MHELNKETEIIQQVLITDLDGTFIPLPNSEKNKRALSVLSAAHADKVFQLIFCTGRHFASVAAAMEEYQLPSPDWIICDVGTSIHQNVQNRFPEFKAYNAHLKDLTLSSSAMELHPLFADLEGLVLQQDDHQKQFKLCYECTTEHLPKLMDQISQRLMQRNVPYDAHGSIDPFLECGLIDILPAGVSKAYAMSWLESEAGYCSDQVIYAGDSGNDFTALTSGCQAIIVANASKGLPEKVMAAAKQSHQSSRVFLASENATSGVLEGCQHFGWMT